MYNPRMISRFELDDKLRNLGKWGLNVPILNNSNDMPTYRGTDRGVEIYAMGGRRIEVPVGHVIDSHGNVVNLSGLNQQMMVEISKPLSKEQNLVSAKYRPIQNLSNILK